MAITVPAVEPSDPNFVKVLASFDGGVGFDEPRDRSLFGNAPIPVGVTLPDAPNAWFGCPNAIINQNSGADLGIITNPTVSGVAIGLSDFTIEIFIKSFFVGANSTIISLGYGATEKGFRMGFSAGGQGQFAVSVDGITEPFVLPVIPNDAFNMQYFAIQRQSNVWSIWLASDLDRFGGTPQAPGTPNASRILTGFNPGAMHQSLVPEGLTIGGLGNITRIRRSYTDSYRVTIGEALFPTVPLTIPVPAATNCDFPFQIPAPPAASTSASILNYDPTQKCGRSNIPRLPVLK